LVEKEAVPNKEPVICVMIAKEDVIGTEKVAPIAFMFALCAPVFPVANTIPLLLLMACNNIPCPALVINTPCWLSTTAEPNMDW
jgi:hypothetical protein